MKRSIIKNPRILMSTDGTDKLYVDTGDKCLPMGGSGGSASKYAQPEWGHEVSNGTVEVLPERTYNWPNENQHFSTVEEDNFSLVSGKVYTVNYNGVSYSCTACDDERGAGVLIGGEGYPFEIVRYIDMLAEMQNAYGQISVFDDSNPFTVSVTLSEEVKVYHKIPGEYVGGGAFVVNLTYDEEGNPSVDKTFEEIREAAKTQPVILISSWNSNSGYGVYWYQIPLVALNDDGAVFVEHKVRIEVFPTFDQEYFYYRVNPDGSVTESSLGPGGAPV